uniref:Uncharacterized protein n=1 Tax=Davidia involucrata TaxID=16924 RepID=A0A5B6Z3L2_DAVIN
MDPILYRAAMNCDIDVLEQNKDQVDVQVTPNNNTVLHVAAQFHNNSACIIAKQPSLLGRVNSRGETPLLIAAGRELGKYNNSTCVHVKEILAVQPSLLCRVNSKGETPLHIAAREGHTDVAQSLIEYAKAAQGREEELESVVVMAKEMLRMRNKDGDTALHEAVRNNHLDVVKLLTQEDPEFSHPTNNAEESPLYLAVERRYCDFMSQILRTCTSPNLDYSGPDGRTALHAAAIKSCQGCRKILYDWRPPLTKEADKNGWTPLHYAALSGNVLSVRQLLDLDKSVAYLIAEEDERKCTALHIATNQGHVDVMKELLTHCPDCWEMINGTGQNILHIAVESEEKKAIKFILGNSWHIGLINQKDASGNTPLHLFATSNNDYMPELVDHTRVDKNAFNKENLTPLDVAVYSDTYTTRGVRMLTLTSI